MGNIPIKPILKTVKTHGPKAGKFVVDNLDNIGSAMKFASTAAKKVNDYNKSKKEEKQKQGKTPYRKARFNQYNSEILHDLNNKNRIELLQCKLEVSQFIQQINNEEQNEAIVKKPFRTERSNKWNQILIQIEDKMKIKEYQEFLMIYNNPNYKSSYFEGFEGHLDKFKNHVNNEDKQLLYQFIESNTGRNIEEIKRDFD